jgi:hypothetical protein
LLTFVTGVSYTSGVTPKFLQSHPPRFVEVERNGSKVSLDSVGARTDGSLPKIRVFWD